MSRMKNPTRADDEMVLEKLHIIATKGTAAAMQQLGLSNSAIQGLKNRYLTVPDREHPCTCKKPENQDGGMTPRWWNRGFVHG